VRLASAHRETTGLQADAGFSPIVADVSEAMDASPFHPDELEAQARAGHAPRGAGIRRFMPDQHRSFFPLLPYLFVATTDADGWPLATMLNGPAGFVHAPDPVTLRIDTLPEPQDPAAATLRSGEEIGILGIDFTTRRRNRANGQIADLDAAGFTVAVRQSFGNCAKYIQLRAARDAPYAPARIERLATLDAKARELIGHADTLFVASRARSELRLTAGVDISHRGGRPGFVRVEGDALTIPDFQGNRYYNTLGNLLGEPRASLLFIDFEAGDLLQLQGRVTIDWGPSATKSVEGAERLWRFDIVRGWRRHAASSLQWSFVEHSPATLATGSWAFSTTTSLAAARRRQA
jgi:predicted pyridoxine 5'-phosphate oxidase superfamily flavin-nucleotide-binding protein